MKHAQHLKSSPARQQVECIVIFFVFLLPLACVDFFFNLDARLVLASLFVTGWFTWTFAEYILHRFWNHAKNAKSTPLVQRHNHHHVHPTEIRVSATQRIIMVVLAAILITLALSLNKSIMIAAGAWTGVCWFFLIHYSLHQKWSVVLFPRLVRYHIVHHCQQPDSCFGISTIFWDLVFRTTPQKKNRIPGRIITFYYRKDHEREEAFSIGSIIDEKLSGESHITVNH